MSAMRWAAGTLATLAVVGAASTIAMAQFTFVDSFDDGRNVGGWSYFGDPNNPVEIIESAGGNPGGFLHCTCNGLDCLDTFAPQPRTQLGLDSHFTGNYRSLSNEVTSLGIDLILFRVDFSAAERPLTLMLRRDAGVPGDPGDDLVVYVVGRDNVPLPGEGWKPFDFDVPSVSPLLPPGWRVLQGSGDDDADWNAVMADVDQVSFFYGDPEFFFIFQQWEPGLDNPRISKAFAAGDMNCDGRIDAFDIEPFTLALFDPAGYGNRFPHCPGQLLGDVSGDGQFNAFDIEPFVELLFGP